MKLGAVLLIMLLIGACAFAASAPISTNAPRETQTLIPALVATPQAARANAQVTISAGESQMAALAVKATALSLDITAAYSTEQASYRQTQARWTEEALLETRSAEKTRQASQATNAAAVTQRSNQVTSAAITRDAINSANAATVTQAAVAVQIAERQAEIERIADESQQNAMTLIMRTWGLRIFIAALGFLALVAISLAIRSAWQFRAYIWDSILYPIRKPAPAHQPSQEMRISAPVPNGQPITASHIAALPQGAFPNAAPWPMLEAWRGRALPLGITANSLLLADPDKTPHLLIAGTSGSGKTMCGLRPLTACALVGGWRVILLNDAAGDFAPLRNHQNLTTVNDSSPESIAEALEWLMAEVNRRDRILKDAGVSTWSRLPTELRDGPPTMVVIDELVAMTAEATPAIADRIWRAAIHITSKGRKMALSFVAATTDPTYRTLGARGLTVRDNCGRILFRVGDASTSQAMLERTGGEALQDDHFMALLSGVFHEGRAFHPSDDQISAFLQSRPVASLPEAALFPVDQPAGPRPTSPEIARIVEQLRPSWETGVRSKRGLAASINREYAGAFTRKLDEAVAILNATTTTETAQTVLQ